MRIRAGAAFSPERLQQAFDMQTPNTALAGSRLVVETRAEEHICPTCGHAWTLSPDDVAGHAILCPACGHPDALTGQAVIELLGVS